MKRVGRLLLIGTFAISGIHAIAAYAQTGAFPYSEHGPNGTLIAVNGKDSAKAEMIGALTEADALEACERNLYGQSKAKIRACMKTELKGATYLSAEANCPAFRIKTARGDSLALVGYSDGRGVWKMESGKLLEESGLPPSVGRIADAQFKMLCPAFAGKTPNVARAEGGSGRAVEKGVRERSPQLK